MKKEPTSSKTENHLPDYTGKFNLGFILLHPKRTLDTLRQGAEDAKKIKALNDNISLLQARIERLESDRRLCLEQSEKTESELRDSHHTIKVMSETIVKLRLELDEKKEIEQHLDKFVEDLKKVEDLKSRYESKISKLQTKLNNALRTNKGMDYCELDEPKPIIMDSASPPIDSASFNTPSVPSDDSSDDDELDWLQHI